MCGLTLSIRLVPTDGDVPPDPIFESLCSACSSRGPDSQGTWTSRFPTEGGRAVEVRLYASVLGLRGSEVTVQPLVGKRGALGWNGQVFQGLEVPKGENDTKRLLERLEAGADPEEVLTSIEGPYAFIYVDVLAGEIHYRLDPLSRRSILVHPPDLPQTEVVYLSSVRSPLARERGLAFRALGGGETGVIHLGEIKIHSDQSGEGSQWMDFSPAPYGSRRLRGPVAKRKAWSVVMPINSSVPTDDDLLEDRPALLEVERFIEHLTASIRRRVENIPDPPNNRARIAILFSGGVDCSLLACLAHRCIPPNEPIDLINVAFGRPGTQLSSGKLDDSQGEGDDVWRVPDRISGLEALGELRQACAGREWRFVHVNIRHQECSSRRQRIVDLMYPSITEMDLSLAYPLYFASRGRGHLEDGSGYESQAKVFISGLGADEQLGGYARHRNAFRRASWPGLLTELQLDLDRLPTRNLGRDDRILSSHARDARYPYLDLSFIDYLSALPVWVKCDPRLAGGGDKLLLRLAAERCGLIVTGQRVKRAMQFGTRSSKIGGGGRGTKVGARAIPDQ